MLADMSKLVNIVVGYGSSEASALGYFFASDKKHKMNDQDEVLP